MNRRDLLGTLPLVLAGSGARAAAPVPLELVETRKLWDAAPHNAFTDLLRRRGEWFCVFREGAAHVAPDGALRVLVSRDGREWTSAARITDPDADLRDAKLCVTPAGELMLSGAAALRPGAAHRHQSYAWFSKDGRTWSEGVPIGDPDVWLWRTTWHDGHAYSLGYSTSTSVADSFVRLYRSADGRKWETLVPRMNVTGGPNEHALLFEPDGTAYCLLRRDGTPNTGLLGTARAPYTDWTWKDLGVRIGGPALIRLPGYPLAGRGRTLAAVRLYDGRVRTSLCELGLPSGPLTEMLPLPSGGDTSYAGMVWHEGQLWISYYSSHEGKTRIYLARARPKPA